MGKKNCFEQCTSRGFNSPRIVIPDSKELYAKGCKRLVWTVGSSVSQSAIKSIISIISGPHLLIVSTSGNGARSFIAKAWDLLFWT